MTTDKITNKIVTNVSKSNFNFFNSRSHTKQINKPSLLSSPTITNIRLHTLPNINSHYQQKQKTKTKKAV